MIVGFSIDGVSKRLIYDGDKKIIAKNINPYLVDAPNIFVGSRTTPVCDVPKMQKGSIPVDGGNLIIESEDIEYFLKNEPKAAKYVRKILGAKEYINRKERFCLWLIDADPAELMKRYQKLIENENERKKK